MLRLRHLGAGPELAKEGATKCQRSLPGENDEHGTGVDECSALHESTEDYGAKRSEPVWTSAASCTSAFAQRRSHLKGKLRRWTRGRRRDGVRVSANDYTRR